MSAVRGQIQYGTELTDTSGLRYPTGLPGFGAFGDYNVQAGDGQIGHPNTVMMNSYVNRIRYSGAANCAVILSRASPGNIVIVAPDVNPWIPAPAPLTVWAQGHDSIYVTGSSAGDIDRSSVFINNSTVVMFIALSFVLSHSTQPPPIIGVRWRVVELAAPGGAAPGPVVTTIGRLPESFY